MKRILSLGIVLALAAGGMAFAPKATEAVSAGAEDAAVIQPMAMYEFDDAENPGKDTSANGYDLVALNTSTQGEAAMQVKTDETTGKNYLSLISDRSSDGMGGTSGACLYAPQLGNSGMDFSDLIRDSYTVTITFRRDNTSNIGDHYMLATGRYNDSFQLTPWRSAVQVQVNNMYMAPGATDDEKQAWLEAQYHRYPRGDHRLDDDYGKYGRRNEYGLRISQRRACTDDHYVGHLFHLACRSVCVHSGGAVPDYRFRRHHVRDGGHRAVPRV